MVTLVSIDASTLLDIIGNVNDLERFANQTAEGDLADSVVDNIQSLARLMRSIEHMYDDKRMPLCQE